MGPPRPGGRYLKVVHRNMKKGPFPHCGIRFHIMKSIGVYPMCCVGTTVNRDIPYVLRARNMPWRPSAGRNDNDSHSHLGYAPMWCTGQCTTLVHRCKWALTNRQVRVNPYWRIGGVLRGHRAVLLRDEATPLAMWRSLVFQCLRGFAGYAGARGGWVRWAICNTPVS